jgi:hypothetical protein
MADKNWNNTKKYESDEPKSKLKNCNVIQNLFVPILNQSITINLQPGKRSRYSDWLRARQRRCRSSSPGRVKNFFFSTSSRPTLGLTQSPIQWVPGAPSPGVKRLGHETNHSPPATAEVKKMWIYTSTPA